MISRKRLMKVSFLLLVGAKIVKKFNVYSLKRKVFALETFIFHFSLYFCTYNESMHL